MNKKEALYFTDLVEILKSIPDIEISTEDDGFSIKINSHSPLEEVKCKYVCENRKWSKNYILVFEVKKKIVSNCEDIIVLNKATWDQKNNNYNLIVNRLNDNELLSNMVQKFIKLGGCIKINIYNQIIRIRANMLPGTIVSLILPPITKFIVPQKNEIVLLLQIMQIILKELKYSYEEKVE